MLTRLLVLDLYCDVIRTLGSLYVITKSLSHITVKKVFSSLCISMHALCKGECCRLSSLNASPLGNEALTLFTWWTVVNVRHNSPRYVFRLIHVFLYVPALSATQNAMHPTWLENSGSWFHTTTCGGDDDFKRGVVASWKFLSFFICALPGHLLRKSRLEGYAWKWPIPPALFLYIHGQTF